MIRFLQQRGKFQKIFLGGLLVVICVMLVITLIPTGGGGLFGEALGRGPGEGVLAKVGDQEVTVLEVQQTARRIGRQQFGGRMPQQLMPYLMQRAADSLIVQSAMAVEARRMGFRVTDDDVREELQHGGFGPQLFPGGSFVGQEGYAAFTQNLNLSIPQFETLIKQDLLIRKLSDAVQGGVTVSDADLQQEFRKQNTKVKLEYAVLTIADLMKQIKPSEAELKAFYEQRKKEYENSIPEKRKVRYVVIDAAKLPNPSPVAKDELQRYYQQHQDEFRVPEEVNVRHILIKTPPPGPDGKPDPKAVEAAKSKAAEILKQIKAGKNFSELAGKVSEDPGSAKRGGTLGWIQRGRTVPEFEKVAFSLPKGQTSDLVHTAYGFHIIHVDDKHEPHLKTLDEVRAQIEPIVQRERDARLAENLGRQVETEARTQGLDKAAAKHGLQVIATGFIARTDTLPGVSSPEFLEGIFGQPEKSPPETARVKDGYAVYQVTEIKPPSTPSFEEARDRVEREFKQQRASAMLAQKAQELSDRARAQHDLKKAAKELGAAVKTSELVSPGSQVPDLGSMSGSASVAFAMNKGEISAPISASSNAAVLAVLEKQEPAPAEFEKSKEQLRETVLRKKRSEFLELFVSNLRQRMEKEGKIKVNQKEMKRITATAAS